MKITVPIPEKVSLNKIYAGIHFSRRAEHKDEYHFAVACVSGLKPWAGPFPVKMHYHFKLRGNQLDISNHAYMLKMIEDSLVSNGVLPDDTPKYVSQITISAEKIGKGEYDEAVIHISTA